MYAALGMPIKKPAGNAEFAGPIWGRSPRWPARKARAPDVSASDFSAHYLSGSLPGGQQCAKEANRCLGFLPLVPTQVLLIPGHQFRLILLWCACMRGWREKSVAHIFCWRWWRPTMLRGFQRGPDEPSRAHHRSPGELAVSPPPCGLRRRHQMRYCRDGPHGV